MVSSEDSDVVNALKSHENDWSQSSFMTPATAAPAPKESIAAIDSQSVALAATAMMKSALDDLGRPPQMAIADNN